MRDAVAGKVESGQHLLRKVKKSRGVELNYNGFGRFRLAWLVSIRTRGFSSVHLPTLVVSSASARDLPSTMAGHHALRINAR